MNQEIKVTKCHECPYFEAYDIYGGVEYLCKKDAFDSIPEHYTFLTIHPNCPLKGKTITYKIGENE